MRKSEIRKIKKINKQNARNGLSTQTREPTKSKSTAGIYFSFICCMGLAVWSINIYRNTIVDWTKLIAPVILGAVAATAIFYNRIKKQVKEVWAVLFLCFVCGGSVTHFLTMFLNQKFADPATKEVETFYIKTRGRLAAGKGGGRGQPYVEIDFYGSKKQIIFGSSMDSRIFNADSVQIEYCDGLLGYKVISQAILK